MKRHILFAFLPLTLGSASWSQSTQHNGRDDWHTIDVFPIDAVEIERNASGINVFADFTNPADRPVCIHQHQLPEGPFNEGIFRIVDNNGDLIEFRPGYPYRWPDKYVFVPAGAPMRIWATMDGQYDIDALDGFSLSVSIFGYYCSELENDTRPYISPDGIWGLNSAPHPGVVSFRSNEITYIAAD